MKIKHILFDIDDTLFSTTEFAQLARKNAINAMIKFGLKEKPKKLYSLLLQVIKEKGSNNPNHFNILLTKLKIKDQKAKYIAAGVRAYHETKHSISTYPQVPRILLTLRDSYKIHVATDGRSVKQWDKLMRLGIALLFNEVFISEELKVRKSTSFFKKVLKKLNAKPEECLMVGDKPDSDILPAKKLGIKTIRIKKGKHSKLRSNADVEIKNFSQLLTTIKKLEH